jgi:hypothetical protein
MLEVELKVLEGRQQGKAIPLNVRQFLIGREQDCHLRPNSELVSRHHCVFTVDDYAVRLRDLGSTNGTYVNGERLQGQVVLKAGDRVSVGKLSFEMVVRQAARVAQPVGGPASDSASKLPVAPPPEPDAATSDTAALNVHETVELTAVPPADDTAVIETFNSDAPAAQPVAAPQPAFLPSNPYPQPAYGVPPGYGMPGYMPGYPAGYPQVPGYPPGYGMPPGYMPPGYGMQPMMPGYGVPQQPGAPPEAAPGTSNRTIEAPPVVLPNPEDTGARAPAPAPPPPPAAEGQPVPGAGGKKPSDAAADIIRTHRTRRPT